MTVRSGWSGRVSFATRLWTVVLLVAACGGPFLANPPAQRPIAYPAATNGASPPADPQPVILPRDDGPHHRLTEWWYYTGHLRTGAGREYGFEFVVFRAERGSFPVSWASHLALTDEAAGRIHYAQRTEVGPQVDRSAGDGFDLAIGGDPNPAARAGPPTPWEMRGGDGADTLAALSRPSETSTAEEIGLDLRLRADREPALHDRDGWVDFGPAGGSYYYSRTRLEASGGLTIDGQELAVIGSAWFDHQWGDFIAVGGGGWDWFAVNLDDGTDLTLSLVRDRDGSLPLVYGTLVGADGEIRHLASGAFEVETGGQWRSPTSGADYPAGWTIVVPDERLRIVLTPTVADQELDTRASTGVVYWEGSQVVRASRAGRTLGGEAYVELTGYGPTSG